MPAEKNPMFIMLHHRPQLSLSGVRLRVRVEISVVSVAEAVRTFRTSWVLIPEFCNSAPHLRNAFQLRNVSYSSLQQATGKWQQSIGIFGTTRMTVAPPPPAWWPMLL